MDLTLFELHLEDAEFNAPFANRDAGDGDREAASGDRDVAEESADQAAGGSQTSRLGPVAALLAFVGLALLARYLRGGEAEQATLDEVEA